VPVVNLKQIGRCCVKTNLTVSSRKTTMIHRMQHMREAVANRRAGRPAGSGKKEQVAIRFDKDVLSSFRAAGPGWQTRMNDALREWLNTHSHG
jgi:uncharacterized protein (DUF4415 family)